MGRVFEVKFTGRGEFEVFDPLVGGSKDVREQVRKSVLADPQTLGYLEATAIQSIRELGEREQHD